MRPTNLTNVIV